MLARALVLPVLVPLVACGSSTNTPSAAASRTSIERTAVIASPTASDGPPTAIVTLGPLPTTTLTYPGGSLPIELAITEPARARGLGFRDLLPPDSGMLFDMQTTQVPTFWMKGMRFPLDMVWISDDKKIASVTANIPPQPGVADDKLVRYSPYAPVRYVLELNAGAAARLGLSDGMQVGFQVP